MSTPIFTPTLEHIERDLFGPSDQMLQCWAKTPEKVPDDLRASLEKDESAIQMRDDFLSSIEEDNSEEKGQGIDALNHKMPEFLQHAVNRLVSAQQANYGQLPQAGQIVSVSKIHGPEGDLGWDLPRPHAVLLSEPTEHPDIWYGWMVAPETMYASEWDFVIQEDDGLVSPFAGSVQMWNPVHLYLKNVGAVIGRLNADALYAARMIGVHMITNDPLPTLGQAGAWVLRQVDKRMVVTGQDIVEEDDPRIAYQQMYVHAAIAVKEPARLVATEPGLFASFLTSLQERLLDIGDLLAPQPRVALAMGEPNTAYRLGSLPLQLYLSEEADDFLEIVIAYQADAGRAGYGVLVLDDCGIPLLNVTLDPADKKEATLRIPVGEAFSLQVKDEHSELVLSLDSEGIDAEKS